MKRDFQTELQEARPKARFIAEALHTLGILHQDIDVERAGMLALVKTLDGQHLGDMISLGNKSKDELLEEVRHTLATSVARQALGLTPGGHVNSITELVPFSTANWMCEISFDFEERRYALVGEWIAPREGTPLGWVRDFRLYQAKTDRLCDVPGCGAQYYERKVTRYERCVHVCERHQGENEDALYTRLHPASETRAITHGDATTVLMEHELVYITKRTSVFVQELTTFLRNPPDVTYRLRLDTLRVAAQSFRRSYEHIDTLLANLEQREQKRERGKEE